MLDEHRLEAPVAPTTAPAWVVDTINGDRVLGGSSQPSAMAGYPIISYEYGRLFGIRVPYAGVEISCRFRSSS